MLKFFVNHQKVQQRMQKEEDAKQKKITSFFTAERIQESAENMQQTEHETSTNKTPTFKKGGRPRKHPIDHNQVHPSTDQQNDVNVSENAIASVVKKQRERPRKNPKSNETDGGIKNQSQDATTMPKKRGRQKKSQEENETTVPGMSRKKEDKTTTNEENASSTPKRHENELEENFDHGSLTDLPQNGKSETSTLDQRADQVHITPKRQATKRKLEENVHGQIIDKVTRSGRRTSSRKFVESDDEEMEDEQIPDRKKRKTTEKDDEDFEIDLSEQEEEEVEEEYLESVEDQESLSDAAAAIEVTPKVKSTSTSKRGKAAIKKEKSDEENDLKDFIIEEDRETDEDGNVSRHSKKSKSFRRQSAPKITGKSKSDRSTRTKHSSNGSKSLIHFVENDMNSWQSITTLGTILEPHVKSTTKTTLRSDPIEIWYEMDSKKVKDTTLETNKNKATFPITESKTFSATRFSVELQQSTPINASCALLNVGGPIWALDWCPSIDNAQYAVICVNPKTPIYLKRIYPGIVTEYPPIHQMLQIWSFGDLSDVQSFPPKLVYNIAHNHGFVWDVKWMPCKIDDPQDSRLGVLGMVCSDGTVVICSVPKPDKVQLNDGIPMVRVQEKVYTLIETVPATIKTSIVESESNDSGNVDTGDDIVGTNKKEMNKMMTALSWSPDAKYLVTGAQNGNVALWRVNHQKEDLLQLVTQTRGHYNIRHSAAVTDIAWSTIDVNCFATVANDGFLKLWDVRDMAEPHYSFIQSRHWLTQICIPRGVNGVIIASNDTTIKQYDCSDNVFTTVARQDNPLWGLSVMSTRACFATANANGAVFIYSLEKDGLAKKRKVFPDRIDQRIMKLRIGLSNSDLNTKKLCFALPYHKIKIENVQEFLDAEQYYNEKDEEIEEEEKKKKKKKKKKNQDVIRTYPDEMISLHRVRFHPSTDKQLRNWILVGGQAGIVFLIKVPNTYK